MHVSPILCAIARMLKAAEAAGDDPQVQKLIRELRMAEADLRAAVEAVESATDDAERLMALRRQNHATEWVEVVYSPLAKVLEMPSLT